MGTHRQRRGERTGRGTLPGAGPGFGPCSRPRVPEGTGATADLALREPTAHDDAVARIRDRLLRAHEEAGLRPDADIGLLATYLVTISNGITVQAGDGVGADELHQIADLALQAWSAA